MRLQTHIDKAIHVNIHLYLARTSCVCSLEVDGNGNAEYIAFPGYYTLQTLLCFISANITFVQICIPVSLMTLLHTESTITHEKCNLHL